MTHRFLIGMMDPDFGLDFFSTDSTDFFSVAEEFAHDNWGELEYPNHMILLVVDPITGSHDTVKVLCLGYKFIATEPKASDVVKELEFWGAYHQKHLMDPAQLVTVNHKTGLAFPVGRVIESARNPKSIHVSKDLYQKLKEVTGQLEKNGWFAVEDHFFTFIHFTLGQPIPDVWKEPVA